MVKRLAMLHSKHVAPEELALEATRPPKFEMIRTSILSFLGCIVLKGFLKLKYAEEGTAVAAVIFALLQPHRTFNSRLQYDNEGEDAKHRNCSNQRA